MSSTNPLEFNMDPIAAKHTRAAVPQDLEGDPLHRGILVSFLRNNEGTLLFHLWEREGFVFPSNITQHLKERLTSYGLLECCFVKDVQRHDDHPSVKRRSIFLSLRTNLPHTLDTYRWLLSKARFI